MDKYKLIYPPHLCNTCKLYNIMLFLSQSAETKSSASKSLRYSHGCSHGTKGNAEPNSAAKQVKLNEICINYFN